MTNTTATEKVAPIKNKFGESELLPVPCEICGRAARFVSLDILCWFSCRNCVNFGPSAKTTDEAVWLWNERNSVGQIVWNQANAPTAPAKPLHHATTHPLEFDPDGKLVGLRPEVMKRIKVTDKNTELENF
jgi:hypothetical protein